MKNHRIVMVGFWMMLTGNGLVGVAAQAVELVCDQYGTVAIGNDRAYIVQNNAWGYRKTPTDSDSNSPPLFSRRSMPHR